MKDKIIPIVMIVLLVIIAIGTTGNFQDKEISFGGLGTTDCNVTTVTAATIGDELSSTILSANANRAYAIIQQTSAATNTVSLSFDEGAAATLVDGIDFDLSVFATNTPQFREFGLSTNWPYTGAVTGITDNGSTTLQVTECLYN